jgi:hypothetical protein
MWLLRTDVLVERNLHRQGDKNRRTRNNGSTLWLLVVADCCHPDDGGDMFLQNVSSYKNDMA